MQERRGVIYTCRLPCFRLGARNPVPGTGKIKGHAADFALWSGVGAEVKVGSQA